VAITAAALGGCGGGEERGRRMGSAVWVDAAATPLTVTDFSRLESAGVTELFVEAATVTWEGSRPKVAPTALAPSPGRVRAMLAARGEWPLAVDDPEDAADALLSALVSIQRLAEEAGWSVAGWHLDFGGVPPEGLPEAVRSALEERLLLSASIPGQRQSEETFEEVVEEADFVVAYLYGVREGEIDRAEAWDFRVVQRQVAALEELEKPYLVGVVTRGSAVHLHDGESVELSGVSLASLAWNRGLRLRHGFSLEGIDRQIYEFGAPGPARVGETRLATGDAVRVVVTTTAHIQELRKQLVEWGPTFHLGELYYRLPPPGDVLSLGAENIVHAAGAERPAPRPQLTITTLAESANRVVVRLTLENASSEASDLGQVESNFVELRAVGGGFGSIDRGGFYRYDTLAPDERGELRRNIRNPPVLRLFAPVLGPQARLETGPLEIRSRGKLEDLQASASFLAPYGGSAEAPPRSWTELAPRPTPTPTPP
jgi:hypothetical protein